MIALLTTLTVLSSTAHAQSAYNAHGFTLVPSDNDLHDLLGTWRAETQAPGSFGVEGLFEYAESPLVRMTVSGDQSTRDVVLDNLVGLNIGASYAPFERLGLSAAMPVWFSATVNGEDPVQAAGDLRLAAPVGVLLADPEEGGLGLSVVPFATLPTGADQRFLGNSGVGAGATAAISYGGPAWQLTANVGGEWVPPVQVENLSGGPSLRAALGSSVRIVDGLAVRGEAVFQTPISGNDVAFTESPGEALLSLRGRGERGLAWTAGGAMGLTRGAGAADYRVFAGAGYTFGKSRDPEPTPTPVVEVAPEDASLLVLVQDESGAPISAATIAMDGRPVQADDNGSARFADLEPGAHPLLQVTAATWAPETVDDLTLEPGENRRIVVLDRLGGILKVVALTQKGAPVDARVRFLAGPEDQPMSTLGEDGENAYPLSAGTWRVLVADDTHVPVDSSVVLAPEGFETLVVRFDDEERPKVCTDIVTFHNVHFDFDIDVPRDDSADVLHRAALSLMDCPDVVVEVGGHTDWIGSDIYNIDLSQRRMNSVAHILEGYGVRHEQLIPVGYGESRPIATNATDEGRALNRRVEFTPVNLYQKVASREVESRETQE